MQKIFFALVNTLRPSIQNFLAKLRDAMYRISTTSVQKYRTYKKNFVYALM